MLNKRIKYFVCMLVFFALLFIGYKYFKAQSIIKDGEVLAGMVSISSIYDDWKEKEKCRD